MKKKILFVINTLGRAGAETAMTALLHQLNPEQTDISLYVLCNQGELVHELPSYVKLLNRNYCDCSVLSASGKQQLIKTILKKCFFHASFVKNIPYLIKNSMILLRKRSGILPEKLLWKIVSDGSDFFEETYDLAIAYLEGGAAYYVHDHVHAKKKAAFIHVDYKKAGYTKALDKHCYTDFDRIFTVSDEVKEAFLAVYPECCQTTKVFHNLINKQAILKKAVLPIKDTFHKGISLLTVGRLTHQKGYDCAIKAIRLLLDRGYPVYWYIIGEGPEYKTLLQQTKTLKVSDHFIFMGAKSNPYPYYKAADIYVHATRFEGKSIAIQEAQILGCPVIASDCSGNREQICHQKDGLLCPFTPEGIADSIEALITDPQAAVTYAQNAACKQINHTEELQYIFELL